MEQVLAALVTAALSFPHCLGMCGAFPLHLSGSERPFSRQLCWHAGRIVTYVFLGFLFSGRVVPAAQNVLAVALGLVMVVMGLLLMGALPSRFRAGETGEGFFASFIRQIFRAPTGAGALTLGLATGFLPCPIVLGFLAFSAQSGSVLTGMAVMAAVGVGTVWSLLVLGLTGSLFSARLRRWGAVASGVVLVLLGAATALRATPAFHHMLGCPVGVHRSADEPPACGCCAPEEH